MGGGTGTGAAPIIAKAAKESGALVVGIATTPFEFEGQTRNHNAVEGLAQLSKEVDSMIVVSNNRLLYELGSIPLTDSFQYADAILKQAVEAAIQAINSPILESSIEGASNAIVNVLGGPKALTINQAQEAVQTIREASESNDINVIFGVTIDETMGDEIVVSVIATGITSSKAEPGQNRNSESNSFFSSEIDIEKYRAESTVEAPLNIDRNTSLSMLEDDDEKDELDLDELLK